MVHRYRGSVVESCDRQDALFQFAGPGDDFVVDSDGDVPPASKHKTTCAMTAVGINKT